MTTETIYYNWHMRLNGRAAELPGNSEPEAGYWRQPVKHKTQAGASVLTDWEPVAIWPDGNAMQGVIGRGEQARDLNFDQVCKVWEWVREHPISYATYKLVAEEGGAWPDADKLRPVPVAAETHEFEPGHSGSDRHCKVCGYAHDNPVHRVVPKAEAPAEPAAEPAKPALAEHESIKIEIATLREQLKTVGKIEDERAHAIVLQIRADLAALRLKAERAQKGESAPHYKLYKDAMEKWNPTIHTGKIGEGEAKKLCDDWATAKMREKKAAEEAERRRQEEEAERANQWADRAIAAEQYGEAPPELPEQSAPISPPPPPPPARAGNGRVRKPKTVNVVTIVDMDAVYKHFCKEEVARNAIFTVLQQLAQARVNAGEIDIPGITTEERVST